MQNRLLEIKNQESYFAQIVARYMQFCTSHSNDLESTLSTLSLNDGAFDELKLTHIACNALREQRPNSLNANSPSNTNDGFADVPLPSQEMWSILQALRKLREALLATAADALSPLFAQRVHVFGIRLAILAFHPPSYHPPLMHLLFVLHTAKFPLPASELSEMTTYLALDMATRQQDMAAAMRLRANSRSRHNYQNPILDKLFAAIVSNNWIAFWKIRTSVDGYLRALMYWPSQHMRRHALKAIGRAYMHSDVEWIVQSATGGEMSWEQLVHQEDIGWTLDGSKVVIRKPKA